MAEGMCAAEGGPGDVLKQEEGAMNPRRFHGLGHDIHTPLVLTPLLAGPEGRVAVAVADGTGSSARISRSPSRRPRTPTSPGPGCCERRRRAWR